MKRKTRRLSGVTIVLVVCAALAIWGLFQLTPLLRASSAGGLTPWSHSQADASDGVLPDNATVFDEQYPGVANLKVEFRAALQAAATDAASAGVSFYVNSGWRSSAYQRQLLDEAIQKYGSATEAGRWVAPVETSLHVGGGAVDISNYDALDWLSQRGAAYGLCQIYANEPWHYELRPDAAVQGCPQQYSDATEDPRLH